MSEAHRARTNGYSPEIVQACERLDKQAAMISSLRTHWESLDEQQKLVYYNEELRPREEQLQTDVVAVQGLLDNAGAWPCLSSLLEGWREGRKLKGETTCKEQPGSRLLEGDEKKIR